MHATEGSRDTQADAVAAHKKLVEEFILSFYNEKDFDRARSMLTEDYVNHHPGVGVGRDQTVTSFREQIADQFPEFSLTVRRMVAEGDHVWTHSVVKLAPDMPGMIVVDIWRIRDGKLAEHWDVGQSVPDGVSIDDIL